MVGSTLTGRGPPASEPLTGALAHARGIAAEWIAAGLQVGLVEHASRDGRPDAHDLVARSPARVLHCACRPVVSRAGRTLWTIEVSLGRCDEDRDGIEHVRLLPVGVAGPAAHEPAWRQVVDWIHGGGALHADREAALAQHEDRRGWVAAVGRCRPWLRAAIGRRFGVADLAGAADRLGQVAPLLRWCGAARPPLAPPGDSSPGAKQVHPQAGQAGPPAPVRRAAGGSRRKLSTGRPLLGGVSVCLGVLGLLVVSSGVADWRFSKRDERAYRHYARLCAAAVRDGDDRENEFWCQRARELRASYGFAEVAGPPGGAVER